jgi:hypothetical protein
VCRMEGVRGSGGAEAADPAATLAKGGGRAAVRQRGREGRAWIWAAPDGAQGR